MKFKNIVTGEMIDAPIGTEVFWRPCVHAFIQDTEGRVLLVKDGRSNEWEPPGGGIDIGEDPHVALRRETREETGHVVKDVEELPFAIDVNYNYRPKEHRFYESLTLFFSATIDLESEPEPLNSEEHMIDMRWFTFEEIKKLSIGDAYKVFFEKIISS